MNYAELETEYIVNLRRTRELAKPNVEPCMAAGDILRLIKRNASESYALMQRNNVILKAVLFEREAEKLTDGEAQELAGFAKKLFNYSDSEDCGLAYKIHEALLLRARARGDEPATIEELYWCGVTLYYVSLFSADLDVDLFSGRIRKYFSEGAGYFEHYERYDEKTRGFIVRCVGNRKMRMPRQTAEECREYIRVAKHSLEIFTSPYYRGLNPGLPWDNFIYSTYMDQVTLTQYLVHNDDPEIAQWMLHAAEYVVRASGLYKKDDSRTENWRTANLYNLALYFCGMKTLREEIERQLHCIENADRRDYSPNGIRSYLRQIPPLMGMWLTFDAPLRAEYSARVNSAIEGGIKYLRSMPPNNYPRVVSSAIVGIASNAAQLGENSRRYLLDYLLAGHSPTYIHSLMVAMLTRELTRQMLKTAPENLAGLCGYTTAEQLRAHADELCELAYRCGVYHDIGKSFVLMYVSTNARSLLDEEFDCIRLHPEVGAKLLTNTGHNRELAQAALYHHCFYDGTRGYPLGFGICPSDMKGLVDILTVADSLEAATDGIGRCYTAAKSYEMLVSEVRAQSGTRYSPAVAALFDDETFSAYLAHKLTAERESTYIKVYSKTPVE